MKLYHGSNMVIEQIDLSKCKPYKDFGQGFYLTEIKEQAEQMRHVHRLSMVENLLLQSLNLTKQL